MQFIAPIHTVVFMVAYWASLFFIGYVCSRILWHSHMRRLLGNIADFPWLGRQVIYLAMTFVLFSVFTAIAYGIRLPAFFGAVFYLSILVVAIIYFFKALARDAATGAIRQLAYVKSVPLFSVIAILLVALVLDFIANLYIGGYLGGDSFIHISKIRHIAEHGFTLTDAYYGTVPETRHHLSVMHTVYAIPAILGIEPVNSWFFSMAPLKFTYSAAMFLLVWRLLISFELKNPIGLASSSAILTVAGMYLINVPGSFVPVWVALLVIGLFELITKRRAGLVLISCVLIAMTHSLVALSAILFIALLMALLVLFSRKSLNRTVIATLGVGVAILITTPLVSFMMPDRMTDAARNYGADGYRFIHVGNFVAFMPDLLQYLNKYSPLLIVLATLGLITCLILTKLRSEKLIIASLIIFVPLTLYNPVFVTILNPYLPAWAQARFMTVNVLNHVAVSLGLLACVVLIFKFLPKIQHKLSQATLYTTLCLILFVTTQSFNTIVIDNSGTTTRLSSYQHNTYSQLMGLQSLLKPAQKGSVVLADRYYDNFMIPDVADLRVIAISEGNSTPAADMTHRTSCYEKLHKSLSYDLLHQTDVKYVAAKRNSQLHDLAASKSYLKLINGNETHELFEVQKIPGRKVHYENICNFNE